MSIFIGLNFIPSIEKVELRSGTLQYSNL